MNRLKIQDYIGKEVKIDTPTGTKTVKVIDIKGIFVEIKYNRKKVTQLVSPNKLYL